MRKKYTYANEDYIGGHKIYCFRRSFSDINPLKMEPYNYIEGDYVPVLSNNYVYDINTLIIDFKNRVAHIIEDSRYKKTVHIGEDIDISIYEYFTKKRYLSIDIYGCVLDIENIFDVYRCVNSFPSVNVYLEEKKGKFKKGLFEDEDFKDSCVTVLDNINHYRGNSLVLSGYVLDYSSSLKKEQPLSFEIANQINKEVLEPLIEEFKSEFYVEHDIMQTSNRFLEILDLLYELARTDNGKLIKYTSFGKEKVTHIDKLRKEIKCIIDNNTEF